jgi:hypothetical protein
MTEATPTWHPYDPGEPSKVAFENDCSLLVLLATPAAREREWAERAAISLARDWAKQGERVFLVDLAMSRPRLHSALGDANGEGVSDLLLYGASLKRITRTASDGFLYAPSGTPVLDGARALRSARWSRLADGFAQAGAQLVAFLPADEPGREAVLTHARRVLVLASTREADTLPSDVEMDRIRAVLAPPAAAAAETARAELVPVGVANGSRSHAPLPPLSPDAIRPPVDDSEAGVPLWRVALLALLVLLLLAVVLIVLEVIPLPGFGS